jgi:hypothetical protein
LPAVSSFISWGSRRLQTLSRKEGSCQEDMVVIVWRRGRGRGICCVAELHLRFKKKDSLGLAGLGVTVSGSVSPEAQPSGCQLKAAVPELSWARPYSGPY